MPTADRDELLENPTALTAALATGAISAVEAMTECLRRLRLVDATTNCVAAWNNAALDEAARLDRERAIGAPIGRLHGVPFTVKDWVDVSGMPCSGGFVESRDRIPAHDATVVARMRGQGAIVMAKTAVQVDSARFGPVFNPHDRTRSPGGSSSGEGAAVGGGGSPIGIASDSGGSIRLPAAWCGAVALKPSAGLVPTTGHFPRVGDRSDGRTQIGPMSSNVDTLIEVLRVIAGPDERDAGIAPVPLGDPARVSVDGLRVGWSLGDDTWTATPAVRAAVTGSIVALEARGATVIGEVPHDFSNALDITQRYWKRAAGASDNAEIERQLADWDRYATRMLQATRTVDVIVMPATPDVAPPHRPMTATDYVFLLPASLTGAPAVVLPVASDNGLPIAVQVVAHRWHDHIALAAAQAVADSHRAL
jgi:amidase